MSFLPRLNEFPPTLACIFSRTCLNLISPLHEFHPALFKFFLVLARIFFHAFKFLSELAWIYSRAFNNFYHALMNLFPRLFELYFILFHIHCTWLLSATKRTLPNFQEVTSELGYFYGYWKKMNKSLNLSYQTNLSKNC